MISWIEGKKNGAHFALRVERIVQRHLLADKA